MTYPMMLGKVVRNLEVCPLTEDKAIAYLDVLGDLELLDAFASLAAGHLSEVEVLLAGDTVGLVVAHHLSVRLGLPYVAARKRRTPNMIEEPLTADVQSVAARTPAKFYLPAAKARLLAGRRVAVTDEVMSTGSTVNALLALARASGCHSVKAVVIATEGVEHDDVVAFTHLPIFSDGDLSGRFGGTGPRS